MSATRVGLCLAIVAATAALLGAQQQRQVFVSVVDSRGVPVLGLGPDAFKVFENQALSKTLKVEPIDWPTKLTVLVDNGLGTASYLANIRTGLRSFFNEIPDDVEMSLLTLAPQPRWIIKPTTDLQKVLKSVDLITPDRGISRYFDGLSEAAARIDREKGRAFPVIVVVTTDVGGMDAPFPRDYQRLNQRVKDDAITVHFVLLSNNTQRTIGGVTGGPQLHVGTAVTQLSGGRFEHINSDSRLTTLLPEIGQQIAQSQFKQSHQYRVTYEAPADDPKTPRDLSVSVTANSAVSVEPSIDGHLP
jgi:hypothetical protein